MNKISFFLLLIIILSSCATVQKPKDDRSTWDMEKYVLESFKLTDGGKYQDAINLLNNAIAKFPNGDIFILNYNIGYNLYLLKKYDDANGYFNTVINLYSTSNLTEVQKIDDKKFATLSNIMLDKIKTERDEMKDPYHTKEDIEKNKTLRSKKTETNKDSKKK
jgi:tetratricopeptide (TPR) repeat protein